MKVNTVQELKLAIDIPLKEIVSDDILITKIIKISSSRIQYLDNWIITIVERISELQQNFDLFILSEKEYTEVKAKIKKPVIYYLGYVFCINS